MEDFINRPIIYLKGVGPNRGKILKEELGIETYGQLLNHLPFRYIDKTNLTPIGEINQEDQFVQIKGRFIQLNTIGNKGKQRLSGIFKDNSGTIEIVWFKAHKWIKDSIQIGSEYVLFGKPNRFKNVFALSHPEMKLYSKNEFDGPKYQPIYPSTEILSKYGLNSRGIEKLTLALVNSLEYAYPCSLSDHIHEKFQLFTPQRAFKELHRPSSEPNIKQAYYSIKFEELFYLQLQLIKLKQIRLEKSKGLVFDKVGAVFLEYFENHLPFDLTGAQKKVIKEIRHDLKTGKQMNRLLQGDVGSGKTVVSLLLALLAIDNGFQVALMAPTEILAQQHFVTFQEHLYALNKIKVSLLTGSIKGKKRDLILQQLKNNEINIIIGTHALIEDWVAFSNLGLVIIDEQHRFGVEQRAKLWQKGKNLPPHVLIMTATPIPRTLSMTFYGDLDISVIGELPPGRKVVKTVHYTDKDRLRMFGFVRDQIAKGLQVYVVYPLIEESKSLNYKDLQDGYESFCRFFKGTGVQVGILHGKMKPEDKETEMQRFKNKETQILVSTTVIEVGVNIPNASTMVIESAEKFGLSQLHQLRGRVGRGADQSYCILMSTTKVSADAKTRINTMVRTNDGFEIAEVDLKLRGPGDLMGTKQSGTLPLLHADLSKDGWILDRARKAAIELISDDVELVKKEHEAIKAKLNKRLKKRLVWSQIS